MVSAVALFAAQALYAQSPQGLRVVPLVRDGQVFVTFELRDGFTPELRAAIQSGLKTTFTYAVDLRLAVPGWIDRTIASTVLSHTVKYDNRLRTYDLQRTLDGRVEEDVRLTDSPETNNEEKVKTWLTVVGRKPLFRTDGLQPNREYYVRVSARARPSNGSILWPFGSGTSAQATFTFIR